MGKGKNFFLESQEIFPQALVLGQGPAAEYLVQELRKRGCRVVSLPQYTPLREKFDYLFQFGGFSQAEEIIKQNLKKGGKFLFIEEKEEILPEKIPPPVRVLRVGEVFLWSLPQLVEQIFQTIFARKTSSVVDVRKKTLQPSSVKKPPEEKKKNFFSTQKITNDETLSSSFSAKVEKTTRVPFLKMAICLFLFFPLFVGVLGGFFYLSSLKRSFSSLSEAVSASDWESVSWELFQTKKKVAVGKTFLGSFFRIFPFLTQFPFLRQFGEAFFLTEELLNKGEEGLSFFKNFQPKGFSSLSTDRLRKEDWEILRKKIKNFSSLLSSAQNRLKDFSFPFFPKEDYRFLLENVENKLAAAEEIWPLGEEILFSPQTRLFLLLFQNSLELRPTGGFIGSFALLKVGDGQILDFQIKDVYTADGQLKAHVEPPLPIRKYLGQPNFFLRDSNFDPDFAYSAEQAAWFLEKELGQKVDGVIALNLFFVQELLEILGPVKLADFSGEEITASNLFFKSRQYIEKDFFPGSTAKKDFLASLTLALQEKMAEKKLFWLEMAPLFQKSLEQKNLLFYAKEKSWQEFLEKKGWAGRIWKVACTPFPHEENGNCLADYLSVNEANLGVNKANYFVTKSVILEKKFREDGKIVSLLTLAYENAPESTILHGGPYQNYLRLFVPKGSELLSASLNGQPLSLSQFEVDSYGQDKTSFALFWKLGPGNRGELKITYLSPFPFSEEKFFYQFFFQKQAGDKISPLVLTFSPPRGVSLSPLNFSPQSISSSGEIFYTTDTAVDRIFVFKFKKRA